MFVSARSCVVVRKRLARGEWREEQLQLSLKQLVSAESVPDLYAGDPVGLRLRRDYCVHRGPTAHWDSTAV